MVVKKTWFLIELLISYELQILSILSTLWTQLSVSFQVLAERDEFSRKLNFPDFRSTVIAKDFIALKKLTKLFKSLEPIISDLNSIILKVDKDILSCQVRVREVLLALVGGAVSWILSTYLHSNVLLDEGCLNLAHCLSYFFSYYQFLNWVQLLFLIIKQAVKTLAFWHEYVQTLLLFDKVNALYLQQVVGFLLQLYYQSYFCKDLLNFVGLYAFKVYASH